MSCKCIDKIEKNLKKEFGPSLQLDNAARMITYQKNGRAIKPRTTPPNLRFSYHPKKKDGSEAKRRNSRFIINEYCSYCGKKY